MGTRRVQKRPAWTYQAPSYLSGHQQRLARNDSAARTRVIATLGETEVASSEAREKDGHADTTPPRSPELRAVIAAADARRRADNLARDRARTHNPISPEEVACLERLGAEIRRLRLEAGLTIVGLAELADRHSSFVARIERGSRRARLDTLRAIAAALASRGVGSEAELTALFAGFVVVPESVWPGWPERMAKRRAKKKRRQELEERRYQAAILKVQGRRTGP